MSKKDASIKSRLIDYSKYFIKEIIPVTVGILIALSIGNWNQNKKDQKYIKEILSIIDHELEETLGDINEVVPLQQSLVDSLDFYTDDAETDLTDIVSKVNGFYIPNIRVNAWKALSVSKIELIDYRLVSDLSNIEEQKEILKTKGADISNFLFSNPKETGSDKKEAFKLMVLNAISTEKTTKQLIEKLQDEHRSGS